MERQEAREQLKGQLRAYVESITTKSKGANMYVCPLCGSGTGSHSTGAFSVKDGTSWKCFSCNEGGDIFDLIGKYEGITGHGEQLERAGELFGVTIGGYEAAAQEEPEKYQNQPKSEQYTHSDTHTTDYTQFFLQANKDIEKTSYHRGLTLETLNRFKVGYVESWRHPKAPNAPASPRLIIPTSKESYLARDTRSSIPEGQKNFSKSKVGKIHIFNAKALNAAAKPIFIVEGELDALSVIDVGGEAIALGTTSMVKSLLELLKKKQPKQPLIIALDNDDAGKKACKELTEGLQGLNIAYCEFNPEGKYKDPNEALQADREAFKQLVKQVEQADIKTLQEQAEQAKKEAYLSTSTANYIQGFVNGIADSVNTPFIPTGFNTLDKILDGGLYEGLYILGAISSLGKTTFTIQVADQIAQSGQDVLIFSLEMARTEIMAKSISRHTIQEVLTNGGNTKNAKTTRGITVGKRYEKYNEEELELISQAVKDYSEYAQHLFISEGIGNIGIEEVREAVEKHKKYTGKAPVVVIDYLQILAPCNERATDKQNTDKAVMELKRISRDYKIPVIGISSFNRNNYFVKVCMEAFKESGAIEYSSDVLIGLQLKGAGTEKFDVDTAKQKDPREVELIILKNRNGRTGDKLEYHYYPLFNYFKELGKAEEVG